MVVLSLVKQQSVATHTFRQSDIRALLKSWVTNPPSIKMPYPQKMFSPCIFVKTEPA
jgi:hypothetical protein